MMAMDLLASRWDLAVLFAQFCDRSIYAVEQCVPDASRHFDKSSEILHSLDQNPHTNLRRSFSGSDTSLSAWTSCEEVIKTCRRTVRYWIFMVCCATESIWVLWNQSGPVGYSGCEFLAHAVGLLVLDRIRESNWVDLNRPWYFFAARAPRAPRAARIGMEKKSDQKGQGKAGHRNQHPRSEEPLHPNRSADPFSQT